MRHKATTDYTPESNLSNKKTMVVNGNVRMTHPNNGPDLFTIMSEKPKPTATRPKHVAVIGHYKLEKEIGEGNFAKVKLGKHVLTNEQVYILIGRYKDYRQD